MRSVLRKLRRRHRQRAHHRPEIFLTFCAFQVGLAYLLTAFIGPSLISPDVANNAMPLYFCRPFSRTEYVIGKMSVLLYLLSIITWIPGSDPVRASGQPGRMGLDARNLWIAGAVFVGPMIWIVMLSLIAMAISAWVKWKTAAGAAILGVFFVGAGFGAAINAVMRTKYGSLIDLSQVMRTIWDSLFRLRRRHRPRNARRMECTGRDCLLIACGCCSRRSAPSRW